MSFTATGSDTHYRFVLVNASAGTYQISLSDTTLYSAAWSTGTGYATYYSLKNTTGATINGTLTLFTTSGSVASAVSFAISKNATYSTNTMALGTGVNQTGTAMFVHDGPPGAVLAESDIANFNTTPAYVQPVKFVAARAIR